LSSLFCARPKAPEGWRTPRRSAFAGRWVPRASVLECGSPLPLFPARARNRFAAGVDGVRFKPG